MSKRVTLHDYQRKNYFHCSSLKFQVFLRQNYVCVHAATILPATQFSQNIYHCHDDGDHNQICMRSQLTNFCFPRRRDANVAPIVFIRPGKQEYNSRLFQICIVSIRTTIRYGKLRLTKKEKKKNFEFIHLSFFFTLYLLISNFINLMGRE